MKYLIDNQLFIVCSLLLTKRFVRYCKVRGISTSEKQLERFEEIGIFGPVARMRDPKDEREHPKTRLKFEETDGRRVYRGRLEEDE